MAIFEERTGSANPFNTINADRFQRPSFVDIDRDGDLDVFTANRDSGGPIRFFRNNNGAFTEVIGAGNPLNAISDLTADVTFGDVNGDGDLDAVIGQANGKLSFFRNSNGRFTAVTGTSNPFNNIDVGSNSSPELIDFDRDGRLELAVASDPGSFDNLFGLVRFFENTGSRTNPIFSELLRQEGNFNRPITPDENGNILLLENPFDLIGNRLAIADVDGDGRFEGVTGNSNGTLIFYKPLDGLDSVTGVIRNDFAATFQNFDIGSNSSAAFMDANNDGDLDIVVTGIDPTGRSVIRFFENTSQKAPALIGKDTGETLQGTASRESIEGRGGTDTLLGLGNNDTLLGGAGTDSLNGGAGNDILNGGSGQDTYTGGTGRDVFLFTVGGGSNTVRDFQNGQDSLFVVHNTLLKFSDLSIVQNGSDTQIRFGSELLGTLLGVSRSAIEQTDFRFATSIPGVTNRPETNQQVVLVPPIGP